MADNSLATSHLGGPMWLIRLSCYYPPSTMLESSNPLLSLAVMAMVIRHDELEVIVVDMVLVVNKLAVL